MSEHDELDQIPDEQPEPQMQLEPVAPMPLVRCQGEGYITRRDTGERIPFTFEGEGRL